MSDNISFHLSEMAEIIYHCHTDGQTDGTIIKFHYIVT